jgi:hypothetical protein
MQVQLHSGFALHLGGLAVLRLGHIAPRCLEVCSVVVVAAPVHTHVGHHEHARSLVEGAVVAELDHLLVLRFQHHPSYEQMELIVTLRRPAKEFKR